VHIEARLKGTLHSQDMWQGEVLSVHRGFINLIVENGLIVTLLDDPNLMQPFGVMITPNDLNSITAKAGQRVKYEHGKISIDTGTRIGTVVSFLNSAAWSGAVKPAEAPVGNRAAKALKDAIIEFSDDLGFAPLVSDSRGDRFTMRAAVVLHEASLSAPNEKIDVSGLIGLGIGLTPSGDDFVTGALLAEAVFADNRNSALGRILDRSLLQDALSRTVPAGRTLLFGALKEQFPEYLLEVGRAIAGHIQGGNIRSAIAAASHHGATSGIDSCAGVWWYLDRVLKRQSGFRFHL
jgi:hypothetical protein